MQTADAIFDQQCAKTFRASGYAERLCRANPALLEGLRSEGAQPLSAFSCDIDRAEIDIALRQLRQRFMLRLIFRDINGLADFDEVVTAITNFADFVVNAAATHHQRALAAEYGLSDPQSALATPLIVGMGKLGGGELNAGSDIDLIFIHAADGQANASRSWHQFHSDLGKRVIRTLDEVTGQGFVFRVDMRLRPYGASGPLVTSIASLDDYFRTAARPWERYAWLKGRLLTGDPQSRRAVDALIAPFVYRRYHDYAAINEMRELHAQIRAEAAVKRRVEDIKVGAGGIREVEFVAQLHQLIRGGRESQLQTRSTRAALGALKSLRLMPASQIDALATAYYFLRNLEHRLQYLDDQQTQALPSGADAQQRIAEAMGFRDWQALLVQLDMHRAVVVAAFETLFAQEATTANSATATKKPESNSIIHGTFEAFLAQTPHPSSTFAEDRAAVEQRVSTWQRSARTASLPAKLRARIGTLIPAALQAALSYDATPKTFFRLLDLIEAVDKRETYLALLAEYPGVLNRVAHLAALSAWAANFLKLHPILLDEFVASRHDNKIDWTAVREQLRAACDNAHGDVEKQYEILRHTKQVLTLKLNLADIEGRIGVMALSDELSALADLLLTTTIVLVARTLGISGDGVENWNAPRGFAILGYGKLGSKELGYASDLDLVFVYDQNNTALTHEQVARLGQRINSWLNTMTAGGILYETDMRLRPDGAAGLLVSTLDAFASYQRTRAWTWEHQALTRARWCAGDPALSAAFDAIRAEILSTPRDSRKLRSEITEMRDKMRAEKKDKADALDLKHTRGGIVDIEFIVQYLILAYSREHPEFLGNLGNFALLLRAGALGLIDEDAAAVSAKAYLAYRERQHRARTNNETKTWIGIDELATERRVVGQVWKALLEPAVPANQSR